MNEFAGGTKGLGEILVFTGKGFLGLLIVSEAAKLLKLIRNKTKLNMK
jgi:hypothetical protein